MSSEWRPFPDSKTWVIRETHLEGGWMTEFRRPPEYEYNQTYYVFVTADPFHIMPRNYLEPYDPLDDPLMALALTYHFKEKYGERSENGGVRSAGAEGD